MRGKDLKLVFPQFTCRDLCRDRSRQLPGASRFDTLWATSCRSARGETCLGTAALLRLETVVPLLADRRRTQKERPRLEDRVGLGQRFDRCRGTQNRNWSSVAGLLAVSLRSVSWRTFESHRCPSKCVLHYHPLRLPSAAPSLMPKDSGAFPESGIQTGRRRFCSLSSMSRST